MESGTDSSSFSISSEEQMKIFLKVVKTVAVNVKRSDCVSDLKASLCEKEGISQLFQELFFSGKRLNDEQKLIDCGIQESSTLNVFVGNSGAIKLYVTIFPKQTTVEIEAKSTETIEIVKKRVCSKEGIDLLHQYSVYNAGVLLDDLQTLASIGINSESTLHMVFSARDTLSVSVEFPDGKSVKTKAKISFCVADFKAFVGSIAGLSVVGQFFYFQGQELDDRKTLACYDLKEDSTLTLRFNKIMIKVKLTWTEEVYEFYIDPELSVAAFRVEVNNRLNFGNRYMFKFGNTYLGNDHKDLASYGIKNDSMITASPMV